MSAGTIFLQQQNFIDVCYIVAFSLFIYGMSGLTGPRTAVRGNQIAAIGHGDRGRRDAADAARLGRLLDAVADHARAACSGTAIGLPGGAPGAHDRDAADGGAVQRRRRRRGGDHRVGRVPPPLRRRLHAEGRRSRRCSRRSSGRSRSGARTSRSASSRRSSRAARSSFPGQAIINGALFVIAVASAIILASGTHSQALFILGILVTAALLGNMVVLPIGGADMPVVISLLNAFTGLSAAATGIALNNTALIVGGMIVGASGTILTNLMAKAMNRSVPGDRRRWLRRRGRGARRRRGLDRGPVKLDHPRRRRDPALLRAPGRDRARVRDGRRAGPVRGPRPREGARGQGRHGAVRDPSGRRADARAHERAAGRVRRCPTTCSRRWTRSTPSSSAPT